MEPKLIKVIQKPDTELYPAIVVTKDTKFTYENENVKQSLENLVYKSETTLKGDNYESKYITTINLKENDVLIFEENSRGYILPVDKFVTVEDAINDLKEIEAI